MVELSQRITPDHEVPRSNPRNTKLSEALGCPRWPCELEGTPPPVVLRRARFWFSRQQCGNTGRHVWTSLRYRTTYHGAHVADISQPCPFYDYKRVQQASTYPRTQEHMELQLHSPSLPQPELHMILQDRCLSDSERPTDNAVTVPLHPKANQLQVREIYNILTGFFWGLNSFFLGGGFRPRL